ncbi:MAG: CFI-box-CTERM domain-containing protein [Campylobacterota bacterium]|nr:CFI-box-CTERM domain-containing protein [Campylobacterota bacterium]
MKYLIQLLVALFFIGCGDSSSIDTVQSDENEILIDTRSGIYSGDSILLTNLNNCVIPSNSTLINQIEVNGTISSYFTYDESIKYISILESNNATNGFLTAIYENNDTLRGTWQTDDCQGTFISTKNIVTNNMKIYLKDINSSTELNFEISKTSHLIAREISIINDTNSTQQILITPEGDKSELLNIYGDNCSVILSKEECKQTIILDTLSDDINYSIGIDVKVSDTTIPTIRYNIATQSSSEYEGGSLHDLEEDYRWDKEYIDFEVFKEDNEPYTVTLYNDGDLPVFIYDFDLSNKDFMINNTQNNSCLKSMILEGDTCSFEIVPVYQKDKTNYDSILTIKSDAINGDIRYRLSGWYYDEYEGCFIATAAYGSYFNPYVKILRDFRDEYLLTNVIPYGSKFVDIYYTYSPNIADIIAQNEFLKSLVRVLLLPIIFMIGYPIYFILFLGVVFVVIRYKTKEKLSKI